jgi:hypothetical protein
MNENKTFKDKAQIVWNHYLSRQLPENTLEPNWIHLGYELVSKFVKEEKLKNDEKEIVNQIVLSHFLKDGYSVPVFPGQPKSPMRIIHDGWKAGSPTWIFMGRALTSDSAISLSEGCEGWIAVNRTIPDEFYKDMDQQMAPATLWMAYKKDKQMGITSLTSNVIGPAISLDQLKEAIVQHEVDCNAALIAKLYNFDLNS